MTDPRSRCELLRPGRARSSATSNHVDLFDAPPGDGLGTGEAGECCVVESYGAGDVDDDHAARSQISADRHGQVLASDAAIGRGPDGPPPRQMPARPQARTPTAAARAPA